MQGVTIVQSDPAAATCYLGPMAPDPPWRLIGPTRLYVEVEEGDCGALAFEEWDPKSGQLVESGTMDRGVSGNRSPA